MGYFRIVRAERRSDGIWFLLTADGVDIPGVPVAMVDCSLPLNSIYTDQLAMVDPYTGRIGLESSPFWLRVDEIAAYEGLDDLLCC